MDTVPLTRAARRFAAAVLVVVVSGCSGGEIQEEPSPDLPSVSATQGFQSPSELAASTPASAPSPGPTEAAIVAYLQFWDVLGEAGEPPDPDHPGLSDVAADPQLRQLRDALSDYEAEGLVRRELADHAPAVRVLGGGTAIIEDCMTPSPDSGLFDAGTGERVSAEGRPGQRQLLEVELELIDGVWKVVNVNVEEEDSSCDPAS